MTAAGRASEGLALDPHFSVEVPPCRPRNGHKRQETFLLHFLWSSDQPTQIKVESRAIFCETTSLALRGECDTNS